MDKVDGAYEADPSEWLRAFEAAVAALPAADISAIVISGNGPNLVPVTGEPSVAGGRLCLPAAPARLWLDRRAEAEAAEVSALMGAFVDASFFFPKALHLKNSDPALYEKSRAFLYTPEYLACALTGEARTVLPSAGFERWYWLPQALEQAGLDAAKFPPYLYPGDCIGEVSPQAASLFGFRRGVKVYAGGPDFYVAILGAGVTKPGQACDRSGSSEGVNLCTEKQVIAQGLMSYGHPVAPWWNLSGIISTTGRAMSWLKGLLGMKPLPYADFYRLAAQSKPGSGGESGR
jgi:xylulokinase